MDFKLNLTFEETKRMDAIIEALLSQKVLAIMKDEAQLQARFNMAIKTYVDKHLKASLEQVVEKVLWNKLVTHIPSKYICNTSGSYIKPAVDQYELSKLVEQLVKEKIIDQMEVPTITLVQKEEKN
jgi:uncharacterized membrane protein YheB (UPF0754 family)